MSYVNRWLIIKWNDELTGNFQANSILQLELTTIALEPEIFLNVFLSFSLSLALLIHTMLEIMSYFILFFMAF